MWMDRVRKYLLENSYREKERGGREREGARERGREREGERVNNMLCYGGSAEVIKGRS